MRPGERNANDGYSQSDRRDDVPERKPPSRQQQPDHVSDQAQRSGADVGASAALAHGRPIIVMAMMKAAITQAAAIHSPPKTIQRMFRSMETGAMRFLSELE